MFIKPHKTSPWLANYTHFGNANRNASSPFYIAMQVICTNWLFPLQGYLKNPLFLSQKKPVAKKGRKKHKKTQLYMGSSHFTPFPPPTLSGKTPRVFFRFTEPPWPHSHHWIGQRHHRGVRSRRWQRCNLPRRSGQGRSLLGDLPDDLEMWLSWP